MWKRSKLIVLIVATLVAMVAVTGIAQAQGPQGTDPPDRAPVLRDAGVEITLIVTSDESPMTPMTQVWRLEPGESPAGIHADMASVLASAQSACAAVEVLQKVGGVAGHAVAKFFSRTWWCWNGSIITDGPTLTARGESSHTVSFEGVTMERITDGGRGQAYSNDRAEGRFCGLSCVTAWITKTVYGTGRFNPHDPGKDWDSGVRV